MEQTAIREGRLYLGRNGAVRRVERVKSDLWHVTVCYSTVIGPERSVKEKTCRWCNLAVFASWARERVTRKALPDLRKAWANRKPDKPVIKLSDIAVGKLFTNGTTTRKVHRLRKPGGSVSYLCPDATTPGWDVFYIVVSGPQRGWVADYETIDGKPGTRVFCCTAGAFRKWATGGEVKKVKKK